MTFTQITEKTIEWLAAFGADPEGGVTRLLYSSSWMEAQSALELKMKGMGLHTFYDDVGNLYGRLEAGHPSEGSILTGSHVDTVKCGGKYDGAYGIVAGMLALQYLKTHHGSPKRHLEVVSFCEEEGSRFPINFWGSTNATGLASVSEIENVRDEENMSFEQAMREAGFGKGSHGLGARGDIRTFIELHIEQGAILESTGKTIGIVEQIVGQKRYTVTCIGEANHAGTTPMSLRKDAMRGASEMIHSLMVAADQTGAPLVATVGQISVEPNISNVIPNKATFSIDLRHPNGTVLDQFSTQFIDLFREIATARGLEIRIDKHLDTTPIDMDASLQKEIERICQKQGMPYSLMPSGAGHDSQVFAPVCPTALIFVPSHRGISHSPLEHTCAQDLAAGIWVLIELLYTLGYEKEME